jgi:hypothetical protein
MPVDDVDEGLEVAPTLPVVEAMDIREIPVCPGCGRTESTWSEPVEARDGQTYCCGGCANEEPCVCSARHGLAI